MYNFFLKSLSIFILIFLLFLGGWGLGLVPVFRRIYFWGEGVVGFMPLFRCIYLFFS